MIDTVLRLAIIKEKGYFPYTYICQKHFPQDLIPYVPLPVAYFRDCVGKDLFVLLRSYHPKYQISEIV